MRRHGSLIRRHHQTGSARADGQLASVAGGGGLPPIGVVLASCRTSGHSFGTGDPVAERKARRCHPGHKVHDGCRLDRRPVRHPLEIDECCVAPEKPHADGADIPSRRRISSVVRNSSSVTLPGAKRRSHSFSSSRRPGLSADDSPISSSIGSRSGCRAMMRRYDRLTSTGSCYRQKPVESRSTPGTRVTTGRLRIR